MPGVIPPGADRRRPVLLGRRAEGPTAVPAVHCVRDTPPSAGADVRRLPLPRVGHAGISGNGSVVHLDPSHHPTRPDAEPRIVALVELDDGMRFVSNLLGVEIDDVRNDMPVEVCFETIDDVVLPQFRPTGGEAT